MLRNLKNTIKRLPGVSGIYDFLWRKKKILKKKYRKNKSVFDLVFPIYKTKLLHPCKAFLVFVPDYDNIGDHIITIAEKTLFCDNKIPFAEVSYQHCLELLNNNCLHVFNHRKILINGGGFLGSLWPVNNEFVDRVIESNPKSKIVILPNSFFYNDDPEGRSCFSHSVSTYNAHRDLTVFTREEISYSKIAGSIKNVFLVPDMALSLPAYGSCAERKGCLLILRNDREKTMTDDQEQALLKTVGQLFDADSIIKSDMVCGVYPVTRDIREKIVSDKMYEFSRAELVITDRLHGMILSVLTGTPCIVLESKSTKVRGCYEWIRDCGYVRLCDKTDLIPSLWEELRGRKNTYDNSKLLPEFDLLIRKLKER